MSTSLKSPTCELFQRQCDPRDTYSPIYSQTLVNLVLFSELKIVMPRIPELDYMVCVFEVISALDTKVQPRRISALKSTSE